MGAPSQSTAARNAHGPCSNYRAQPGDHIAHLYDYGAFADYYRARRGILCGELLCGSRRAHGPSRWGLVEGDGADDFWDLSA